MPIDHTCCSCRCAKPHCTNHSTERYTASQLVWNTCAVSRQLSRRAQRAKHPFIARVTGRLPSLHGIGSTTTPCSAHSTRRGAYRKWVGIPHSGTNSQHRSANRS
jgi:hypothetical protein